MSGKANRRRRKRTAHGRTGAVQRREIELQRKDAQNKEWEWTDRLVDRHRMTEGESTILIQTDLPDIVGRED